MPDATARRPPDRPRVHATRGPARVSGVRLKVPDRARLYAAAAGRGLAVSDYLRAVILDALDADPNAAPVAV